MPNLVFTEQIKEMHSWRTGEALKQYLNALSLADETELSPLDSAMFYWNFQFGSDNNLQFQLIFYFPKTKLYSIDWHLFVGRFTQYLICHVIDLSICICL